MKKTEAIKLNKEFKSLYYRGGCQVSKRVVLYFRKNKNNKDINRLGLTVSKKIGNAVMRNKVRRRLKEIYRLNEDRLLSGYDIVLVARGTSADSTYEDLEKDMNFIFRKSGILKWKKHVLI